MSSTLKKPTDRLESKQNSFCSVFGIKTAIIIISFILFIGVLCLFYFSSWFIVSKHKYAILTSAYLYATTTYILFFSTLVTSFSIVVLLVIAWIEHVKGLKIIFVILIITCILEVAAGLLAFAYTFNLNQRLSNSLLFTIQHRYLSDPVRTESFDLMQKRFNCCGSISFKDWGLNRNFNSSMPSAVPDSCCKSFELKCARKPYGSHPSNIYYKGCTSALHSFYHSHLIKVGSIALIVAFFQCFTIVLLGCLIQRLKKLTSLEKSLMNSARNRRLSNEITYFPMQSSSANK